MPPAKQPTNQFDFINNAGQKPKKPMVSLPAGNSQTQRILIFSGIIAVVLIFIIFIFILANRGGENKEQFVDIVQKQSELTRIATLGGTEPSANPDVKITATNISMAVSSDKQSLVAALAKKGMKLKGKQLNGVPNQATTKLLTDAKAAANFDSTLITTLSDQMDDYRNSLEAAYNQTKSRSLKDNLSKAYQHTDLLQRQLAATKP